MRCVPLGQQLNVGLNPTVGAVFSAMKTEYGVVAEKKKQEGFKLIYEPKAHPLGLPILSPP